MESVDADETPTPSGRGSRGRAALRGCLGVLLAGVVVVLAAVAWWFYRAEAAAQETKKVLEEVTESARALAVTNENRKHRRRYQPWWLGTFGCPSRVVLVYSRQV